MADFTVIPKTRIKEARDVDIARYGGAAGLLVVVCGGALPTGHPSFPEAPSPTKVPRNRFLSIIGLKMLRGGSFYHEIRFWGALGRWV